VREGDRKLRDALDKALQAVRLDGTYDRINRKYFPFSIY
jgi:ABC-type amino acid transport substrate-binding protein